DWDLPAAALPELTDARAKLVDALDKGARDRVPDIAATAQVAFDCWVEEAWENEDDAACKDAVHSLLPKLQPPAEKVADVVAPPSFVVYFDFDKAALTEESRKTLDDVAKAVVRFQPAAVRISGHTDTMGGPTYNQRLSQRRADTVAKALADMGVDAGRLQTEAHGKKKLAVTTANQVREQKNRRVEIVFEGVRMGALDAPAAPAAPVSSGSSVGSAPSGNAPAASLAGPVSPGAVVVPDDSASAPGTDGEATPLPAGTPVRQALLTETAGTDPPILAS
ncbi:MAG: OmpA family protein, partial [Actinomycetota bacterium]